jgi:ABC-type Na+ efflux pump permease subunit
MKLRIALMLLAAFVLVSATRVSAQDTGTTDQTLENLRAQLRQVQDREAEVKIRLEQLDFDLKPENIERYFNAVGSTRPEELRESRRRQLQTEKDRLVAQLEQLASSRARLESAITSAQVKAYQQSGLGAAAVQTDKNSHLFTFARVLAGLLVLLLVIGSLVLRLVIRHRRNV